jgi:hypothetical protein
MKSKLSYLLLVLVIASLLPALTTVSAASQLNPLTGLPAGNPARLSLPPALVSISNFPPSARPQAGLSSAAMVFEVYIGEGMTRFLALFYGDYPTQANSTSGQEPEQPAIGPVRSGRVSYQGIRSHYNGILVMASGAESVVSSLSDYTNVFGPNGSDVNSAMVSVDKLEQIAQASGKVVDLEAMSANRFSAAAPGDQAGQAGTVIWLPYSYLNQIYWRYDAAGGAYQRYQDKADAKTFIQATDRLTGQPLSFENVIILFAKHQEKSSTVIDLEMDYVPPSPALLFRDGQMYKIFWTTANGDYEQETGLLRPLRFIDAQGQPFPLKPGQTWIQVVTPGTTYHETNDSQVFSEMKRIKQPGSGIWAIRFYAP